MCVRSCVLECFCVTSQSPLLKHKGPAALSCWGQVLWRADFGCTVALFSRRAAELYLQIGQRSAQPLCQLAFSFPFFFFNVREKADLDPVVLLSPGPSIRPSVCLVVCLSVCLPATQFRAAPPFFPGSSSLSAASSLPPSVPLTLFVFIAPPVILHPAAPGLSSSLLLPSLDAVVPTPQ